MRTHIQGNLYSIYIFKISESGNGAISMDGFSPDHAIKRALQACKENGASVHYAHKPLCEVLRPLTDEERAALATELRHDLYYGRDDAEATTWTEQQILAMA